MRCEVRGQFGGLETGSFEGADGERVEYRSLYVLDEDGGAPVKISVPRDFLLADLMPGEWVDCRVRPRAQDGRKGAYLKLRLETLTLPERGEVYDPTQAEVV